MPFAFLLWIAFSYGFMVQWVLLPAIGIGIQPWKDMVVKLAEMFKGCWHSAYGKFYKENRHGHVWRQSEASDSTHLRCAQAGVGIDGQSHGTKG